MANKSRLHIQQSLSRKLDEYFCIKVVKDSQPTDDAEVLSQLEKISGRPDPHQHDAQGEKGSPYTRREDSPGEDEELQVQLPSDLTVDQRPHDHSQARGELQRRYKDVKRLSK